MRYVWRTAFYGLVILIFAYLLFPIFIVIPLSFSSGKYLTFRRRVSACSGTPISSSAPPGRIPPGSAFGSASLSQRSRHSWERRLPLALSAASSRARSL